MAARLLTSLSAPRATRLHGIACHRLKPPTLAGVLRSFEERRISSRSVRETMDVKSRSFLMYRGEAPFEHEQVVEVTTSTVDTASWSGDLLALAVYDDALDTTESEPAIKDEGLKALDAAFGGALSEVVRMNGFKGKPGEAGFVRVGGSSCVRVAGLVGLGAKNASTAGSWKGIGTAISAAARSNKAASSAVSVLGGLHAPAAEVGQALTQGLCMGGYESTRFKSEGAKPCPLQTCELLSELGGGEDLEAGVAKGAKLAAGSQFTRYLVEAPPNVCTPSYLAAAAAHIAERFPEVMTLEVLEREACEEMGMGLYLGVAECSDQPPKFIHLTYRPPSGAVARKLALVGKGLTFDSGGYNLKAGAGTMIEMMKFDMGGSGAVLGAARALAQLAPDGVEVHFIIASCENMVDGKGLRPGDILQGACGKTVEVNNTDAEGRLTLADALYFAQEKCGGVDAIVDIATLTGACMIALGNRVGGLFVPADCSSMVADLTAAGKAVGEKLHELPMEESYWEQMKSSVADMKNTGGRMGGAITAALFLKRFVETDEVRWAHLDIAGPVWDEKAGAATGFGAATLAQWVLGEAAAAAQESA